MTVTGEILPYELAQFLQVGLSKKRCILIVDVHGECRDADAALAYNREYLQYLLLVCH
jgi:hypothetical protein